jgi:hypothetical protein
MVECREHLDVLGGYAADAQVVDRHEAPDAAAHADERDVDDRDAGCRDHVVGPEVRAEELVVEVARDRLRRQVVRRVRLRNDGRVQRVHVLPFDGRVQRPKRYYDCAEPGASGG